MTHPGRHGLVRLHGAIEYSARSRSPEAGFQMSETPPAMLT
jgi:hypothetical protein